MSTDSTRSDAQREASRTNGAKSQGPVSIEGKRRSSKNATKHGLRSPRVVLANEDPNKYQNLLASYVAEWQPLGITESSLLVRMANADWRLRRIDTMREGTIDNEMFIQKSALDAAFSLVTTAMRQADAVTALDVSNSGILEYYGREQDRLERIFERCKRQLTELQARRGKKPEELDLQPVSLLVTNSEDTNEPDVTGHNFEGEEVFWWISHFVPTPQRSTRFRANWTTDSNDPPKDKVA